jgi:myo-inositol-1(or 4)-monophosphatase
MDRFETVAVELAREAGKLLMSRFRTDIEVFHKGEVDLVTEVDLAAERLIVSRISSAFPGHTILAEENHSAPKSGSHTWIIDPLDGTVNYAHGIPIFAVSIGLEIDGELACGAVYNPVLDELFTACHGGGAFCNGKPIRVSSTEKLTDSILSTGFPYDIRTGKNNNLDYFREFALRAQGLRRGGSAALDFCYVAAGYLDGFWELSLHPWDCAAGYLIVREAGGMVTNLSGAQGSIYEPEMVSSNGLIHKEMLSVLRDTR